jgi:hypothetical protein
MRLITLSLAAALLASLAVSAPAPGDTAAAAAGPRSYLLCQPSDGGSKRIRKAKPRTCSTLGPTDPLCCAANLAQLHWRHWGEPTARARGIERGFHLPLAHIRVRVKVYRRRLADCGAYIYTRLRGTSRHGTLVQRIPAICGD